MGLSNNILTLELNPVTLNPCGWLGMLMMLLCSIFFLFIVCVSGVCVHATFSNFQMYPSFKLGLNALNHSYSSHIALCLF